MQYGYVKVRAATPDLRVADAGYNAEQIGKEMKRAADDGVQLLVFPELCLSGYTCGDLFLQDALLRACENALGAIVRASEGNPALIFVGLPFSVGGKLYNCAAAFSNGALLALVPKTFLPNYNEFYECRHFVPAEAGVITVRAAGFDVPFGREILFRDRTMPAFSVGCEICEDLWAPQSPSVAHVAAGANIIVNLSASNELVGKRDYRRLLVRSQSGKLVCGYVYADAGEGESTADMVFAGHNLIAENGVILAESALFSGKCADGEIDAEMLESERRRMNTFSVRQGGYTVVSFTSPCAPCSLTRKVDAFPFLPKGEETDERAELILSMQAHALKKRLSHTRAKTAVIGVSGGLDSALAFLVTVRAFDLLGKDRKEIVAITMPGFGTTARTRGNSLRLMQTLGASGKTVGIVPSVKRHFKDIGHDENELDVTYENAQARMRTLILMDVANKTGGLVVGTGDLSELALGWCTYNGDHMSMYAVNSSVPKTLVKTLVAYEGRRLGGKAQEVIESILSTEISPELLPPDRTGNIAQKTEDLVGPYELHDFYLYHAIRRSFAPKKIFFLAQCAFGEKYTKQELFRWLENFYRRFFSQQFKRSCVPDGVKVGSVSLSPRADWRMPSDACAAVWMKELEELKREIGETDF